MLETLENHRGIWRFGVYEVDARNAELRRSGTSVRLREQSFRILVHLVDHAGELVKREELRRLLWPSDTFVDFDHGLNTAMMRLRSALGDSANAPVYIETIPKRGYRFVAPVTSLLAQKPEPKTDLPPRPVPAGNGFSIAVLPFKVSSVVPEIGAFAEGLAAELISGLLRFSYIPVIAQSLTQRFAVDNFDLRFIRSELGARYVMEGTLRQAGSKLRVTIRLIDAVSGLDLWFETYEQPFEPDSLFDLQDYLVPLVVSTIADGRGILTRSISESLRAKPVDQMSPSEAVLRAFAYFQHLSAEDHASSRDALEHAVQIAPAQSDCWTMLSIIYKEEFAQGFNLRPDPLGRAFSAAQRALEGDPSNHLTHHALASIFFFRKELEAFRAAADRAITLNPLDGFTIAYLAFLIAFSGEWSLGCALAERAHDLNPHHPGWYWFAHLFNAYRKGEYANAIDIGLRIDMPNFWRTSLVLAASYGQLADIKNAARFLHSLEAARPGFASVAREEMSKWWDPALVEHLLDGLVKSGMKTTSPVNA
jgi:TolB-like protein